MLKSTKTRRCLSLAAAAVLGAVGAVALSVPTTGGAATATTYTYTRAGTDVHTLNPYYQPGFVAGGGVQSIAAGPGNYASNAYFEMPIDLPVGAKVTSIAIVYASGPIVDAGTYTFGSFSPATRNTVQVFTATPTDSTSPKTFTKTGNPITTIASGRRYVIDWGWPTYSGSPNANAPTFYGATVKYTCTTPCVP